MMESMKMKLDDQVLFRVPQFPINSRLHDCWDALKQSIRRSSDNFYEVIKHLNIEDLDKQPETVRHTIWKYFNRARFRATPYGSFGSIGHTMLNQSGNGELTISDKQYLHRYLNWPETEKVQFSFAELVSRDVKLLANGTYYFVGNDIRYVGRFQEGYLLVDTLKTDPVIAILAACKQPTPISAVLKEINILPGQQTFLRTLEMMLDDQLLFCDLHPNIIGTDYFARIEYQPEKNPAQYIIAERPLITGTIDPNQFKNLPDLILKLHQILPTYIAPETDQFKNRFIKKFGGRSVPLMVALDPEIGVGYAGLDKDMLTSELIGQLQVNKSSKPKEHGGSTLDLLLPSIMDQVKQTIDIEDIVPPELPDNQPLPNTLSVLCTVADDLIIIDHIGGTTANALLGRFTPVNDQIRDMAKNLADLEAGANPDVLLFDVGYLVGNHVDNVNRRRSVYDFQLNLLNYDTTPSPCCRATSK